MAEDKEEKEIETVEETGQYPEDMSPEEQQELESFIESGCPGLVKIKDSDIFQWFGLYMSGKTYGEIAMACKKQKAYILFMSKKQNWFQKKMDHYNGLLQNMEDKLTQTKVESMNTLSTIVSALGKYYKDKFDKYLVTNDDSAIENIDTKMLSQFHKFTEALDKLMGNAASDEKGPLVNFNLTGDATVKQIDKNTVEVTNQTAGNILKALAQSKKQEKENK